MFFFSITFSELNIAPDRTHDTVQYYGKLRIFLVALCILCDVLFGTIKAFI